MDITYKAAVNIEEIMDEDKSPKESCVENIMHDIDELGNGKQVRSLRGAIEQQVRRAWNGGFCKGFQEGSEHQAEACCDINWFMMQSVAEYSADELQAAFGYDHLADVIERLTYDEFHDMYEDYEDRKREDAKKIHVGDEILWNERPQLIARTVYDAVAPAEEHAGVVLYIDDTRKEYVVLTYCGCYSGFYKSRVPMNDRSIRKTHHKHFAISSEER